ncbi:MAG: hypothetical protein AB7T49_03845 [Oligoflexales bacterium]
MRLYLLIVLIVTSIGCDKKKEEESDTLGAGTLRGTWTSECRELDEAYLQSSFTFLSETFSYANGTYTDNKCKTVSDIIEGRGTYLTSAAVEDEDGDSLTGIDYVFEEFTWTFEEHPSDASNWSPACEDADVNGNEVDVLGKTCSTESGDLVFNAEQFGSVWMKENMLYASDVNTNGTSANDRSLILDKDFGAMEKSE